MINICVQPTDGRQWCGGPSIDLTQVAGHYKMPISNYSVGTHVMVWATVQDAAGRFILEDKKTAVAHKNPNSLCNMTCVIVRVAYDNGGLKAR